MTDREQQILDAITKNPLISQIELADIIGISRSAIASHITNLTAKGIIEGRGYVIAPENFCVAIGGANMDILGKPDGMLCESTSNPGAVSNSPGGVARNIAENIAKLGNKCYLITAIGNDNYGKQLIDLSKSAGVDTSHAITLDDHSTSSYLSIVDESGEMQVAIADMKIIDQLTPARLQKQIPLLKQAQAIVIDTNLSVESIKYLFDNLPDSHFFVDTVSLSKAARVIPHLKNIHSLKPNLLEAQAISGITIEHYAKLPQLSAWFHQQGVKRLFISLGKDGVFYSQEHHNQLISLPAQSVANSNGAGDAMTAALVHAFMANFDIKSSCYFALAAANCAIATTATINPEFSVSAINQIINQQL